MFIALLMEELKYFGTSWIRIYVNLNENIKTRKQILLDRSVFIV